MPRVDERRLVETLAYIFDTDQKAMHLLEEVGVPVSRLPPFGVTSTPAAYWRNVINQLNHGLVEDGIEKLVVVATQYYPGNQDLHDIAQSVASSKAVPSAPPAAPTQPPAPTARRPGEHKPTHKESATTSAYKAVLEQGPDTWNEYRKENQIDEPNFYSEDLSGLNLAGADLSSANFSRANLTEADCSGANFENTILQGAILKKTIFSGANLASADIKDVVGFTPDKTYMRGAKPSPNSPDPWSVLRRHYTGPRLFFHLLLLIAFILPYVLKTIFWLGVNHGQLELSSVQAKLESLAEGISLSQEQKSLIVQKQIAPLQDMEAAGSYNPKLEDLIARSVDLAVDNLNEELRGRIYVGLAELGPCLQTECEEYKVGALLLGLDKGWRFWALGVLLILYNIFRGILTWRVGPLRYEEEYSGFTPSRREYTWLHFLHYAVTILFFAALVALITNAVEWLWLSTVFLPAGG